MRIVFAGTPQVAVPTLQALAASDHNLVGVVTMPPARRGRGKTLTDSPVSAVAHEHGAPVIETATPRDAMTADRLRGLAPDLGVVVAYGAIISPQVLQIPTHGWINLHFSDLPRWRGAAPVQQAIRMGDSSTATCVFQLEQGLDTGPVFDRELVDLDGTETADSLLEALGQTGAAQVLRVVDSIAAGQARAQVQDTGPGEQNVTLAPRLTKEDAFVDFTASAKEVGALIRSATSNPGAWTFFDGDTRIKLRPVVPLDLPSPGIGRVVAQNHRLVVGCGEGAVELGQVAPAGKSWMEAAAWWRGARLPANSVLGASHG